MGQPFKEKAQEKSGSYILPNKKIFDLENENLPSEEMRV